ncbi:MAG: citrate transporter [Clostridia bacterium]|nr:citrate transporter [Clostridia bacterium]
MNTLVKIKNKILAFVKKEVVLSIAIVAAIITMFFVPVDKEYLDYFEYKTLVVLFCMLAVVAGLKNTNVFEIFSKKLICLFKTRRAVIYALVFGTYFFDMIVANDMSLITLLPLAYIVMHATGNDKYLSITFILMTIAANMGGMITPYGNPQNLYLFSFYEMGLLDFLSALAIQAGTILILLFISGLFIKNEKLTLVNDEELPLDKKRLAVYAVLFVLVILCIFRVMEKVFGKGIDFWVLLGVVVLTVLIVDRKRFKEVDYALLATFCVFFVFSGNIARIDVISNFIQSIVGANGENVLVAGIVSCQFISNVPTAIFLSKFTDSAYAADLLVSVNVGSLGIIISSLASLITLKEYLKHQPKNFKKYMGLFTLVNTIFLAIVLLVTILT